MECDSATEHESLCRLCLEHRTVYFSLFENNTTEMLEALTSIKIETTDPFTTLVCCDCFTDLTNAYTTQQKIIEKQKQLTTLSELCVKKEADEDNCDNAFPEIKMEVNTNEELHSRTNFIGDENQENSDCDDFTSDVTVVPTPVTTLPDKSREQYELAFKVFSQWCQKKGFQEITEDVLYEYFKEKSKSVKCSTLWANYSMVKRSLLANSNMDISGFTKVVTFLKRESKGYRAKKSKTFTREEVRKFLMEAPDETYLMMKVALIFGIAGACRRDELTNMTVNHIDDKGSSLIITIPTTATKKQRVFSVVDSGDKSISLLDLYRKYAALRPASVNHQRFFVSYRNGKCSIQVVGINSFGIMPRKIATWLNIPNPADYNGHCFPRSSPALLIDLGSDVT